MNVGLRAEFPVPYGCPREMLHLPPPPELMTILDASSSIMGGAPALWPFGASGAFSSR